MDNSQNKESLELSNKNFPDVAKSAEYTNDYFIKSPNEDREHYSYYLDNGLQVLLISDPDSKKSAASLDLDRGSGNNPPEHLGLAHYLEHMLFLGTEKYPEADGFQEFIGAHGGSYNAYTSYKNTNYFFDIKNEHFPTALDRFADFFIAPIFNPDFAERERNVVDSEFYTGLNDDGRRYYAVFQAALNPKHPLAKFSVGTKETLSGDATELITALKDFYFSSYRAPLMKLVLYGNSSIEELKLLAETYFSPIDDTPSEPIVITEPIIQPTALPAMVKFNPIKEARYLDYYFPIKSQIDNYKSKPVNYIAYLLNSENEQGLEAKLKTKGWSNGIYSGFDISLDEGAIFNLHISLTPQGSKQVKEITAMVFATLETVKGKSYEKWRYDEVATSKTNSFNFRQQQDPLGYVRTLSRIMQLLPTKRWLSNSLWEEHNQAQIDEIFASLNPDNMLIFWVDPEATKGIADIKQETYYKVPYAINKLEAGELAQYLQPQDEAIALPPKNPFIGSVIQLIKNNKANELLPQRLSNQNVNGWYKFNDSFNSPQVNLHLSIEPKSRVAASRSDKEFYSKILNDTHSAKVRIYNNLMVGMLNDKINQESYQGGIAGYSASLGTTPYGIYLGMKGYNDKFSVWVDKIIGIVNDGKFKQEDFDRILDNTKRSLRNQAKNRPSQIADELFTNTMLLYRWDAESLMQALEGITLETIEAWSKDFFTETNIMAYVYGNIQLTEALQLTQKLSVWNPSPLTNQVKPAMFLDINSKGRFIVQGPNEQGDSAVLLYYQADDYDYQARTKSSLVVRILQPQFFLKLRTEQELGYIVSAYYRRSHQRPGIYFLVQSNHMHSANILERIDEFVADADEFLQQLSEAEFNNYKDGLLNLLAKPPQNFGEELALYRYQIAEGFHKFDDRAQAVAAMESISKQDIIDYWKQLSNATNSIAVLTDKQGKHEEIKVAPAGKIITDPYKFKQQVQEL